MLAEGYSTKIVADSVGPSGKRLTSWELTYPRFVHAELMTHRLFSRNAASSRAIPTHKLIERIRLRPAWPVYWGKNQSGMQAGGELTSAEREYCKGEIAELRETAIGVSERLNRAGLHKQIANRYIEPWMFITVLVTSTEFENWFGLRDHKDAQPELAWVAKDMRGKFEDSKPKELKPGEWHIPYMRADEDADIIKDTLYYCKVATGRCARLSYLTHDGIREPEKDVELHDGLVSNGHWSPFEHVAQAVTREQWRERVALIMNTCDIYDELFDPSLVGNLVGWMQYRKMFPPAQEMRRKFKWPDNLDFKISM